jgi:hypothetical protein
MQEGEMGWDTAFAIYFREQDDPINRFKDLATEMMKSGVYHFCYHVSVYEGRAKLVADLVDEADPVKPLTFEQLDNFTRQYHGPNLGVRSAWACSRASASPPECILEIEEDTTELTILGSLFYIWPFSKLQAHAVIETSDYRNFFRCHCVQTNQRNIRFVLAELALFVPSGAITIRGLDADRSLYPCEHYLCYHGDPDMYRTDLRLIYSGLQNIRPVTIEDLLTTVDCCEKMVFHYDLDQPIIYHQDFTGGNLRQFYEMLASMVKY